MRTLLFATASLLAASLPLSASAVDLTEKGLTEILTAEELKQVFADRGPNGDPKDLIGRGLNRVSGDPLLRCITDTDLVLLPNNGGTLGSLYPTNAAALAGTLEDSVQGHEAQATRVRQFAYGIEAIQEGTSVVGYRAQRTEQWGNATFTRMHDSAVRWAAHDSEASKLNFRSACGDAHIHSVQQGYAWYYSLNVLSDSHSRDERRALRQAILSALASDSAEAIRALVNDNPGYRFEVQMLRLGVNGPMSEPTLEGLYHFLKGNGGALSGDALLTQANSHYFQVEGTAQQHSYWDQYLDYRPARENASRWETMVRVFHPRHCGQGGQAPAALCEETEQMAYRMSEQFCALTDQWDQCLSPYEPACTLPSGAPCDAIQNLSPEEAQ
ncbi:hypothetical protein [Ferrimonas balearica]|uniref:hypothetical protein n=1 Tax=Ferrimonas balearica TaxID=44012 RepID=UPI001C998132|nr:hypothetical protein [Ferrimonas balearica]MBY5993650.1 hypothetical protein [Ferrimonas balearica]